MNCPVCNKPLGPEAAFCGACGTAVSHLQGMPQQTPSQTPTSVTPSPKQPQQKSKKKLIVSIAAVAVLMVAVVVGFMAWQADQDKRTVHAVFIPFVADGYKTDGGSPIPVQVTGADSKGTQVDEVQFMDDSGAGVFLSNGEYDLSFPSSPLATDNTVYKAPETKVHVVVDEEHATKGGDTQSGKAPAGKNVGDPVVVEPPEQIVFTKVDPADVTDEMIENIKKYVSLCPGYTQEDVEKRTATIKTLRDDAVAKREAEEKAKREAEEKAKREEEEARKAAEQQSASPSGVISKEQAMNLVYQQLYPDFGPNLPRYSDIRYDHTNASGYIFNVYFPSVTGSGRQAAYHVSFDGQVQRSI